MKHFIFSIVMMVAFAFGMSAQDMVPVFNQNNFSIGVNGGVQTNLRDWNAPQGAVAGFTFNHQLTPIIGVTAEVGTGINNRRNWYSGARHIANGTAFDQLTVFFDGRVNLMNAIAGFNGSPRVCEVEPMLGIGYGHAFTAGPGDLNTILGKAAVNVNFNVNDRWTINVTPAVIWNLRKTHVLNTDYAVAQLTAGVTYHFVNYYGGQTERRVYTQTEWDALNAEVNALRAKSQEVVIKEVVKEVVRVDTVYVNNPTESVVAFKVNSATLPAYVPVLDAVAADVDAETVVYVTGYASVEGSEAYNKQLSERRANAVRNYLVNKGVNADKIVVAGEGATDKFGERQYNRVVVVKL